MMTKSRSMVYQVPMIAKKQFKRLWGLGKSSFYLCVLVHVLTSSRIVYLFHWGMGMLLVGKKLCEKGTWKYVTKMEKIVIFWVWV